MRAWIVLLLPLTALAGCMDDVPPPGEPYQPPGNTEPDAPDEPSTAPDEPGADVFARLEGFDNPLLVTHAGDGSGRLFVVEQRGTVVAIQPDGTRSTFADIRDRVDSGGEQGLLGMAFHPDFAANRVVLLSYTDRDGTSVLERFRASGGALDTSKDDVLLEVPQPYNNHNGGHIAYGPDGYLYMGLGDGGLFGDPERNGQNPHTLLGSILRLGVGESGDYTIPTDNPFTDGTDGAPEVWVWGLRNPWRFSLDDAGNLWIGDVGQDRWEEVNRIGPDDGGANLGWNLFEGTHQYPSDIETDGTAAGYVFPVTQYANGGADCSVTGGHVMGDHYVFADFCSGKIWSMPVTGGRGSHILVEDTPYNIASFGMGENGDSYIVSLSGVVERFELSA